MTAKNRNKILALCLAAAAALCANSAARANNGYVFSVDTSALVGNSDGPFYMDFQFAQGSAPVTNTVTLNTFTLGGGAAGGVYTQSSATPFIPSPSIEPAGGASGSAAGSVVLTDNTSVNPSAASFNELIQAFTPGATLGFTYASTNNLADATMFTPDEFSFSILDHTGVPIPTTDLVNDTLLTATLNSPQVTIVPYRITLAPTSAAPLPASGPAATLGALMMLYVARSRSRRALAARI